MNQLEIRVTGMSRSGNHAFVGWLLTGAPPGTCFLNCVEGKRNPFETARPLGDGRRHLALGMDVDLAAEAAGRLSPKSLLILSQEDSFLRHAFSREYERHHDRWVGPSVRRVDVLLLRDPFNLFASRRRWAERLGGWHGVPEPRALTIWRQHAREFIRPSGHLRHAPLRIRYDRWVREPGYRAHLARSLGLAHDDRAMERVADVGGGSSFDGLDFHGRASQMAVFDRWRHYAGDASFRALFDRQVLALSEAVFGRFLGVEALVGPRRPKEERPGEGGQRVA